MNIIFLLNFLCFSVNPGPLERVEVNNLQAFENLLPGSTVENLILEVRFVCL